MAKRIGIVACSAEGAALCYRTLCAEASALLGEHRHPEVSLHTHPLAEYMTHIRAGDWSAVARLMVSSARKLAAIGAELAICPDNTIHQAFSEAVAESPIPWLHIAEVVAKEARERGFRRLAVTGTKYLMTGPVYPEALGALGLGWEIPEEDDREEIDRVIFGELVRGLVRDDSRRSVCEVIRKLAGRGCDAVVLGCTELPLLIGPGDSPLPTLDSTLLLARAALRASTSEEEGDAGPGARTAAGAHGGTGARGGVEARGGRAPLGARGAGKAAYSRRLNEALELAATAHREHRRKARDVPYVTHPVHVAMILERHGYPEDLVVAGLLHDVIEDTGIPALELRQRFGERVADLVLAVTETKLDSSGRLRDWATRKGEGRERLRGAGPDVAALKAADTLHNVRTLAEDLEAVGPEVLGKFHAGPAESLANHEAVAEIVGDRLGRQHPLARELAEAVADLRQSLRGLGLVDPAGLAAHGCLPASGIEDAEPPQPSGGVAAPESRKPGRERSEEGSPR